MQVSREFSQNITDEMIESGFELFDADLTGTTVVVREDDIIVAFCQEENNTVYEIESKQKGAGRTMVEWMKANMDFIQVTNSGQDSWGFWEKMGFTQTAVNGYYGEFEWE